MKLDIAKVAEAMRELAVALESVGADTVWVDVDVDVYHNFNSRDRVSIGVATVPSVTIGHEASGAAGALVPLALFNSGRIMAAFATAGTIRKDLKDTLEILVLRDGQWLILGQKQPKDRSWPTRNLFPELLHLLSRTRQ